MGKIHNSSIQPTQSDEMLERFLRSSPSLFLYVYEMSHWVLHAVS